MYYAPTVNDEQVFDRMLASLSTLDRESVDRVLHRRGYEGPFLTLTSPDAPNDGVQQDLAKAS